MLIRLRRHTRREAAQDPVSKQIGESSKHAVEISGNRRMWSHGVNTLPGIVCIVERATWLRHQVGAAERWFTRHCGLAAVGGPRPMRRSGGPSNRSGDVRHGVAASGMVRHTIRRGSHNALKQP